MKTSRCIYHQETGRYYPIEEGTVFSIGRAFDNQVVLTDPLASRHHASIHFRGGKLFIHDLKSSNGTYIRNKKLDDYAHELCLSDIFNIGESTFQVLEEEIITVKNYVREKTPGETLLMYPGI